MGIEREVCFELGWGGMREFLREINKVSPWRHFVNPTKSPNVNNHQSTKPPNKKKAHAKNSRAPLY